MAQFKATIKSYADAEAFLDGRDQRKLAHNTYVRTSRWLDRGGDPENGYEVVYHKTAIATFYADGASEYTNGGYQTATTKQRLNELLPAGYGVYQKDHEWFLWRVDIDPPHKTTSYSWPKTVHFTRVAGMQMMTHSNVGFRYGSTSPIL